MAPLLFDRMTTIRIIPPSRIRRRTHETIEAWLQWPPAYKYCPDCGRTLPIDQFQVKTKWQCGLPRTWVTYCNDDLRERVRFHARERRRRKGVPERPNPYRIRDGY